MFWDKGCLFERPVETVATSVARFCLLTEHEVEAHFIDSERREKVQQLDRWINTRITGWLARFITSSWPHLRCDVGLEEGEYK